MYCPKCSQQQISEEVRFCSRCGFSLGPVRELVARDQALLQEAGGQKDLPPRGQRAVRQGAWLMLARLGLAVITALLAAAEDVFAVLLILPVLCFVIGFLRVLYGVFLADKKSQSARTASQPQVVHRSGQLGSISRPELSASNFPPIERFAGRRIETAEMVRPPSVTENTTRLLDEDHEARHR